MKKQLILIFLCVPAPLAAQTVTNVRFHQTADDKVVVQYDLSGTSPRFEVALEVSDDGGKNFYITPRTLGGDIGKEVKVGKGKQIVWEVLSDIRRLQGDNFVFKVVAKTDLPRVNKTPGIEWVFVPGGTFEMGSNDEDNDEKPVHTVNVSDFYLSTYEVTVSQYRHFRRASGYTMPGQPDENKDDQPVVNVSWNDAVAYCEWLTKQSPGTVRLPTEAEWEYAARGGQNSRGYKYSGSNNLDKVAWHGGNAGGRTHRVGQKQPNELGLYDMSGNVWEWCADWYDGDYYKESPMKDLHGPSSGEYRVLRGGSWVSHTGNCRTANRFRLRPVSLGISNGFRLARSGG